MQEARALQSQMQSQTQTLELGPEFGYVPTETSCEDLRGLPDFASNSWHAVGGATGHGESGHARYSPSPSQMSGAFDDVLDGYPVPRHRAHSRPSRLLSTTSAPMMRSVSRGSRSSEAASDHLRPNGNLVRTDSKSTSLLISPLGVSGEQSVELIQSSPGSVTSHPQSDPSFSTGQRRISNSNATFPMLDTTVADVSQAISSSLANCLKAGTLDQAQMQMIVQTSLLSFRGSQASNQRFVRSRSSTESAGRRGQIACDECDKSVARRCDLKYVHLRN